MIVTSRRELAALAAREGARLLQLDVLSEQEANELLVARLGKERAAAEPWAVTELATLCARLPLALSVVVARAAAAPKLPLSSLAAELTELGGRLDALDAGDPAANVRTVLSLSYRHLPETAARMFRLLGLHPGPDISAAAAASLAGVPVAAGPGRAARPDPGVAAHGGRARAVRVPRPAARLRRRAGARRPRAIAEHHAADARPLPAHRARRRTGCSTPGAS